ncbi:hypothetical protein [Anaerobium acetethylicum]|uniref:hypothetical protein n=1 Tax=Anaerobium acetethylicum TaxID=1619234 RepID=UPI000B886A3B|nr:hypothetical protein [Anaerobium acetethylicum]
MGIGKDIIQDKEEPESNKGVLFLVKDWLHWIPVISFPNGDVFCIDKRSDSNLNFLISPLKRQSGIGRLGEYAPEV